MLYHMLSKNISRGETVVEFYLRGDMDQWPKIVNEPYFPGPIQPFWQSSFGSD